MTDVTASALAGALRDRYTIEHELGRGGMATVYVARDLKHDRDVALKVLHPELAAILGPERFLREIKVAAGLSHPHIVPVFDSGDAGGRLWYTMPAVEGESLRDRLQHEAQLPVEEAIRIAREVALALGHAHRHGVIHRDIKPENVLLSGYPPRERGAAGTWEALVTDFGVALALAAEGHDKLTATGFAVGTPQYMSPEQASGGEVDGRSDIYALGCVLYEMLAGEPPYTGPTPQAVVAKRLSDPIPSIRRLRDEVPDSVDRAIRRALAKTPADRFATAGEFATALALSVSNELEDRVARQPGAQRRSRQRWAAFASGAVVLAVAGVRLLTFSGPALPATDARAVTILPFRVAGAAPSLAYLREGMVDLLAAKLTGETGPRSVDPRTVLSAWRRAGGSAQDDLPRAAAFAVARGLGAGRLIEGSVVGAPKRLIFTASLLSVTGGRSPASVTLEGPLDSLSVLVDRLTARLLAGEAGEAEKLADLTSTSLPALRAYLDGRAAYRQGRYLDAVQQFGRALDLDSTFALAGIGLRSAAGWTGANRELTRGLALAWANQDRLSKRDRLFLVAAAGPRYPAPSSFSEKLGAWERVLEVAPDQPEAQYELADLLFHYGPTFDAEESQARAGRAFARALELDSTFASPLHHLIELAALAHDTARLRSLSQLYLSRNPGADDAVYVRWRVASAIDDSTEQRAIRSRFSQLADEQLISIAQIGQYDGIAMEDVRRALELVRHRAETTDERGTALALAMGTALNEGRPASADSDAQASRSYEPADMPNWSLEMRVLSALYWQGDSSSAAAAIGILRGPARAPRKRTAAVVPSDLLDLCISELWRSTWHEAKDIAQTIARVSAGSGSVDFAYMEQLCAALLDVSSSTDNNSDGVTRKLERLDSLVMERGEGGMTASLLVQAANLELARQFEARGDLARALRALERRAYFSWDLVFFSTALREQARIAALAGDRAAAIRAYQHYLALRFDPEPSQKAEVAQVRDELAKLLAERPVSPS